MEQVFLTGFPGFLSRVLAGRLAGRGCSATLLCEEPLLETARAEASRIAREAGVPGQRLEVVTGDITRPGLGLAPDRLERLGSQCSRAVHLAALYDLAVPREPAERVNVVGTQNVFDTLRAWGRLELIVHVSTVVVAGRRTGLILESELEHDAGFHNHYEETKYLSEKAALERKDLFGLPVAVARPGVVVGSSRTGWTTKYDGPYMILDLLRRLPAPFNRLDLGRGDTRFNMVPVDFVAEALAEILLRDDVSGLTFHLTDPTPLSTSELCRRMIEGVTGRRSLGRVPGPLVRLASRLGLPRRAGLPPETAPYLWHRYRFDCANTLAVLEGTGIACPPVADYLDTLIRYWREHPEPGALP